MNSSRERQNKNKNVGGEFMCEKEIEKKVADAKKEYYRKWRENNKEKIKESNRKYWLKKANQNANNENAT